MAEELNEVDLFYLDYPLTIFTKDKNLRRAFKLIDKRLKDLERTERKSQTTRSQQMLILHKLGLLNSIKELNISNKKIASLLSVLLNASQSNIEDDLSNINKRESDLKTPNNYKVLVQTFEKAGLKELTKEAEKELIKLIDIKEKKKT